MERVRIKLPEQFNFSTYIKIRITDINYGGHVGNDSFLSLVHEARLQFLNHFGFSELKIENTSLIMAGAAIEFKKELVYADEVKISVGANGFDKFGFDIVYKLEVVSKTGLEFAGKAKTGMLCFDYQTKKITALPGNVMKILSDN